MGGHDTDGQGSREDGEVAVEDRPCTTGDKDMCELRQQHRRPKAAARKARAGVAYTASSRARAAVVS